MLSRVSCENTFGTGRVFFTLPACFSCWMGGRWRRRRKEKQWGRRVIEKEEHKDKNQGPQNQIVTVTKFKAVSDLTEQKRKRKKSQWESCSSSGVQQRQSVTPTDFLVWFPFVKFSEPIYNHKFPQNSDSEQLESRSNQTSQWLPPSVTGNNSATIRSEHAVT